MSQLRTSVVGLPVVVTVQDDGTVEYQIDTAETGVSLREDENALEQYSDEQIDADVAAADADHGRRWAALQEQQ